jgi:hypothetical protein
MKYQYFSLGLELLLPRRQNWVGITSLFAIGLCERTGRIANVLGIARELACLIFLLKNSTFTKHNRRNIFYFYL